MSPLHEKPILHGRDHSAGGADPIPGGGGGIDFGTVNEGNWLYIKTTDGTGAPTGHGIEIHDLEGLSIRSESSAVLDGDAGLVLRSFDGNIGINANSSGHSINLTANSIISLSATQIKLGFLPTSNPGVTGQLWNDAGTVKIA